MEEMKAKIASIPPEQRAKMEAMMAELGGAMPGAAQQQNLNMARPAAPHQGKWNCDKHEEAFSATARRIRCLHGRPENPRSHHGRL